MKALIRSQAVISPQHSFGGDFPAEVIDIITDRLSCIEPEYREIINPVLLRRMPRIIKMGLASARMCIDRAGGIVPEGIIIGTGLGCIDNLEKFLTEMIEKEERITTVLPFINSTHNAVAGQVSMLLKNQNYSTTYCHRGFSFESALIDAMMLINEGNAVNVLVGGIDECTTDFIRLHGHLGVWKKPVSNVRLFGEKSEGTIAGEGSAFFMLSAGDDERFPSVSGVHTFFTPVAHSAIQIAGEISWFLSEHGVAENEIDVFMPGMNGDSRYDRVYHEVHESLFTNKPVVCWKHLCGEYYTSTAFALWLGATVLEKQKIPGPAILTSGLCGRLNNILIYNQIKNTEHSLILLSKE